MRLDVGALPEEPLAAAAQFHADVLPRALAALHAGGDLVLVFPPADHAHRDWRLAAVRGLARQFAPARVNALAGADETVLSAGLTYLVRAPGVTGQLLPVDGTGVANMLYQD